jgi:hypothetical protein
MNTPDLPNFILNFESILVESPFKNSSARWINVFDEEYLGRNARNLFATETLFGDWDAEVLVLAQDALPALALKNIINFHLNRGDKRELAWRHADKIKYGDRKGIKTNTTLVKLKDKYLNSTKVLYGSATSHMLYEEYLFDSSGERNYDPNYRQTLKGFYNPKLQTHLIDVLKWVIKNMPNLKAILCLGNKAWDLTKKTSSNFVDSEFNKMRINATSISVKIENKEIQLVPAYHPAAIVKNDVMEKNWLHLKEFLSNN